MSASTADRLADHLRAVLVISDRFVCSNPRAEERLHELNEQARALLEELGFPCPPHQERLPIDGS